MFSGAAALLVGLGGNGTVRGSQGQASGAREAGNPPNILVIVADDLGWNDVGYHNPQILTPHLDRLAAEGLRLNQFYAYPTCSPTRAALLTGRPPSRFGILAPIAGQSDLSLPPETITLPELLRRQEYETALCGKWHLGRSPRSGPNHYGFSYSYGCLQGGVNQYTHRYKTGDRTWHRNGEIIEEGGHSTDLITREAIRFLTAIRRKSHPFFLYVAYTAAHIPLQEPAQYEARYRNRIESRSRRLFAAAVSHMDEGIGQILEALRQGGLWERTLVMFMSDNGAQASWDPGPGREYGMSEAAEKLGSNLPYRGWKETLYEGGIRVPAILAWAGKLGPGRISAPLIVCDVAPTLVRIAGAAASAEETQMEGADVWPLLREKAQPPTRVLYWRTPNSLAVRRGDWKLIHHGASPARGDAELFNLANDPAETTNLAERNPDQVAALSAEMARQFSLDSRESGKESGL